MNNSNTGDYLRFSINGVIETTGSTHRNPGQTQCCPGLIAFARFGDLGGVDRGNFIFFLPELTLFISIHSNKYLSSNKVFEIHLAKYIIPYL